MSGSGVGVSETSFPELLADLSTPTPHTLDKVKALSIATEAFKGKYIPGIMCVYNHNAYFVHSSMLEINDSHTWLVYTYIYMLPPSALGSTSADYTLRAYKLS